MLNQWLLTCTLWFCIFALFLPSSSCFPPLSLPIFFLLFGILWPCLLCRIRGSYGLECLFRLFSYGLERKWREHLFRDFQNVALWDYRTGHVYGLEKFWALLKFRKSTHPISYDPELDVALKAFQKLEDFSNPALLPVSKNGLCAYNCRG